MICLTESELRLLAELPGGTSVRVVDSRCCGEFTAVVVETEPDYGRSIVRILIGEVQIVNGRGPMISDQGHAVILFSGWNSTTTITEGALTYTRDDPKQSVVFCIQEREGGDRMPIVTVTDANFEEVVEASATPFVLDFWAPWCGPCRMMKPVYDELVVEYPDLKIGRLNVDEEPQVGTRYDILSIPTILVFVDGVPVKKLVGAMPKKRLLLELSQWLPSGSA